MKIFQSTAVFTTLSGLLFGLTAGCGRSEGPRLLKISGTISHQGKALPGAKISFIPQDKSARPAMGTSDETGRYQLTTYEPGDGAVVGQHAVAISLRAAYAGPKPSHVGSAYDEELQDRGKPLIPDKYFSPTTSGLTAEIKVDGPKVFDFKLSD